MSKAAAFNPGKERQARLIGVVGTCGSGKSTLISGLEGYGYQCRHIAQEHSHVPSMWRKLTNPDILIFLECSFENATVRRKLNWLPRDHEEQIRRLSDARLHAQIVIDTNNLTSAEVLAQALAALEELG